MSAAPRMLAGFVQSSLAAIDRFDPALGRQVRAHLKPETLDAIESAASSDLVSVDLDVELTERFFELAGPEHAGRALRESLRQGFDKPFLKPLLDGAFALFGRSLRKIIGWAPKVWELIYRDAGRMVVGVSENGRVRLEVRELPLVIASSPDYLRGSAATFAGIFDVVGVAGEVELIGPDLASRSAAFVFTWSR